MKESFSDYYSRIRDSGVYSRISPLRGRGYYLYCNNNHRFLDMYLEGGAYLSGRRSGKSQLVFKNSLEKGLTGGLQVRHLEGRFAVSVKRFLGCFMGVDFGSWNVEAFSPQELTPDLPLYRPWLEYKNWDFSRAFAIINPFPWSEAPVPVIFPQGCQTGGAGRKVSPPFLAASARAFDDLTAVVKQIRTEDFARFDKEIPVKVFERKGPYLFYSADFDENPREIFLKALDFNLLLSPCKELPSFIPPEVTGSEFIKFCRHLKESGF